MFKLFSKFFLAVLASVLTTAVCSQECASQIVSMDMDTMPLAFQNPEGWYSAIVDSKDSSNSKLLYKYENSINGFSAMLTPTQLHSLSVSGGFISSMKDRPMTLFTTRTAHFLGLNYGYGAWPASDFGEGVIIGMVDTGIWPESPSFNDFGMAPIPSRWKGGCENGTLFNSSMCNKKLIGARSFVKGLLAGDPNLMITITSTRDTEGHGTHTSSIAAGNYVDGASSFGYASGTARGMAPRAALAMYKVISDHDTIRCASDVLAAIDQAIADGVDILSISVGYSHEYDLVPYENPFAAATFAAMEKGIFVSMAAGNEGPAMKTLRNDFPWATIVGGGTLDRTFGGTIILGNGVAVQGHALYNGRHSSYQRLPIVFIDSCNNLAVQSQSKIIVCRKTSLPVVTTEGVVQIVSDPARELQDNDDLYSDVATLLVSIENGNIVLDYINKTAQPTGSLYFQETSVGIKPAPMVWDESSRGPSISFPTLLKPDVIAPGVEVLGYWIPYTTEKGFTVKNNTGFTLETGTSTACPHVAGVAALLKKAHSEWSPAAIRSAIMTTADILDNTDNPIRDENDGEVATPFAMGVGHLNPNKALDPGLIYDLGREDYINYLCALNWTTKQIKAVVRSNSFNCSHPNQDLNYPSFIAYIDPNSSSPTRYVFHRAGTNVGDKSSRYSAELTPIKGFNLSVQPQYLEFHDKFQKLHYSLTIEAPTVIEHPVVTGYLSWVNLQGGQVVRSLIVATTLI